MVTKRCKAVLAICAFVSIFAADGITKYLALFYDNIYGRVDITSWLRFSLSYNYGVSWNLLSTYSALGQLLLSSFIFLFLLVFLGITIRQYRRGGPILFEVFVLSGGFANLRDRVFLGCVIDFIELHVGSWSWPTFNVADVFIVLGVAGMIYQMMHSEVK